MPAVESELECAAETAAMTNSTANARIESPPAQRSRGTALAEQQRRPHTIAISGTAANSESPPAEAG